MPDCRLDFSKLETQIDALLHRHQELATENNFLRQKLAKLAQEKTIWASKKQKLHTKIKSAIAQIKEELHHAN